VKLLAKEGGIVPERLLFARLKNIKLVVPRELGMELLRRQEENPSSRVPAMLIQASQE
jgi:hypothetical protein